MNFGRKKARKINQIKFDKTELKLIQFSTVHE